MNAEGVLNKIKSKGYWRVEIRPTKFEKYRIPTFGEVQQLVQSCIVYWRGWDYPHWNERTVQNMEDWEHEMEYWRFYRSGKFIHFFALREDYLDIDKVLPIQYPPRPPRAGYVSFISTTFQVTEIFEFAARLAGKDILSPSAFISIGLYNLKDHELASFSASRFLHDGYVYTTDAPIVREREISQDELVANPDDFALDFIIEIFERFNWNNPPRQILGEEQKRLRERRL
ncbi:hypothetical protein ACFLX1_00705 [Chloroflexota bacterium]